MKGLAPSCLAIMLVAAAFGQTTAENALPIQRPSTRLPTALSGFNAQFVTVRVRYDSA